MNSEEKTKIILQLQENNEEILTAHNRLVEVISDKNQIIERQNKDIHMLKETLLTQQQEFSKVTDKPKDSTV